MPKSRNRRPHRPSSARTPRPTPSIGHILRVDEAERRGDAALALDLMAEMPFSPDGRPFWRPWRVERLLQLQLLGAAIPSWVYSRWLVEQALQQHDAQLTEISRRARAAAVRVRGGQDALRHDYPVDPETKLIDHDWVFRQCHLYEFGGLTRFLRRHASPGLLRRAVDVREWACTPMSGYRLIARASATTTFEDLAGREQIETANIGSAALLVPGEHVIGRMVPHPTGRLFESVPLPVPEELARSVASEPSSWADLLEQARRQAPSSLHLHRFGFVSDLPADIAAMAISDSDDFTPSVLARTLVRTAESALAGELDWTEEDVDPWACFGALVHSPTVLRALADERVPSDAKVFTGLGHRLAEPAALVCRGIANELRQAA